MRTTAIVLALQAGLTLILSLIAGWLVPDADESRRVIFGGSDAGIGAGIGVGIGSGIEVGNKAAYSVLIGGGICMLTSLLFGLRVFISMGADSAQEVLRRFYRGESQKLLLTGVLFYAVIKWLDVNFLAVMVGFIVSLLAFWIALLLSGFGDPEPAVNADAEADVQEGNKPG